jgi:hypothetical protein
MRKRCNEKFFGNQEVIKYVSVTPCLGQEVMEESILTIWEGAEVKKRFLAAT